MRIVNILALVATLAQAQTTASLKFEVASVKPNASIGNDMSLNRTRGGGLDVTNSTLHALITFAYNIRNHQLTGGPGWMDTDRYDIVARTAQGVAAAAPSGYSEAALDRLRLRLRALLADRFKLVVHSETREVPVAALVVAKNGAHLEASKEEMPQIIGRTGILTCKKTSMKRFAELVLSARLGRTVLDKTGINGDFDFQLKYVEEGRSVGGTEVSNDPAGPTFLTAMQEQLGLKLETQKGPVEFIVVDRAEKASAN